MPNHFLEDNGGMLVGNASMEHVYKCKNCGSRLYNHMLYILGLSQY